MFEPLFYYNIQTAAIKEPFICYDVEEFHNRLILNMVQLQCSCGAQVTQIIKVNV